MNAIKITRESKRWVLLILLAVIFAACDGGGNGENTTVAGDGSDSGEPGAGGADSGSSGQFDLAEYLFDDNLDVEGGAVSYPTKLYRKDTGEEILGVSQSEQYKKTSTDTIVYSVNDTGEPKRTFVVGGASIEETVHDADNQLRSTQRFVNVGDKYMDSDATFTLGPKTYLQNATCTAEEHLESFDLNGATGSFNLASGVYSDVLHVQCATSFVNDGQVIPHTVLHHYFAKDIGLVFNEGTMFLLGEVYLIPER